MQYVELTFNDLASITNNEESTVRNAGYAPYLDYRPLTEAEQTVIETMMLGKSKSLLAAMKLVIVV